ncbi:MAG: NTP transferase domain-containing protein [Candidatus Magasanikbacteria bacterium]|nr:NTP transferase domain-containing protein [Candidatus Magasanikbacteria bacterium]
MIQKNNLAAVILAAGKGTRLACSDKPKVMLEIGGKPIVSYVVEQLQALNFSKEHICLVVGFCKEKVMEYFGDSVSYAVQEELKGTAHAAYAGMISLPSSVEHVIVIQGDDSAFYRKETLASIIERHMSSGAVLSLVSAMVQEPGQLGRIVRHDNGDVEVIEKEYTTDEQKLIKEISTGTFVFNRAWFEQMFPTMPILKKISEYGLPTAVAVARDTDAKYQIIPLEDSRDWFGVNTPAELEEAQKRKMIS